ncbi:hypothetical protein ADJ73_10280 [Arsenicicoccus sp. oral taxon 190]|nr:hypothetical protein ADJ73_10280 [Arsenicicoccus sp. oral taxon 190]
MDLGQPPVVPWAGRHGAGLCLSGGGFRAALFHLGSLRRLDELGILGGLRTVSGVSGGSIIANLLCDPRLRWPGPGSADPRVGGFEDHVAEPLRRLAGTNVRTPAILGRLRPDRWFVQDGGVRAMADRFAQAVEWWSTPLAEVGVAGPATVTGATDIAYGVDWRFWDPTAVAPYGWMGDYRVGFAPPPAWLRVADVVATSCAFPPVFGPRRIDGRALGLQGGTPGRETAATRQAILAGIPLSDGGVYDNLGLEPVWKDHATVLVSDGGGVFRARSTRTPFGLMLRTVQIAGDGGTSVRVRWLHSSMQRGEIAGATWGLDEVIGYPRDVVEAVNAIRTDLDGFSVGEQQVLERHGYLVTDALVREHAPELIASDVPARAPHPEVASPQVALAAVRGSDRRTVLGRGPWRADRAGQKG